MARGTHRRPGQDRALDTLVVSMKQKPQGGFISRAVHRVRASLPPWMGGLPSGTFSASSEAGVNVNDHNVLQLSAVWACVRLISETIGTLPLGMHERTSTGKRSAPQHGLHFIISTQPNADTISSVFWEAVVATMLLHGNARCEKLMVGGRVVGLQFLHPSRLMVLRRADGSKEYRYTDEDGRQRVIPEAQVWTIPGWSLDGKTGVSVIQYGAQVFGAAIATDKAAAGTFKRGLMPTVWFKYPEKLKPNQREEAREFIINRASGAVNAGKPIILESGMETGVLSIRPKDAQLLESRGYSVEEICRWFRVPPWMVGHTEKSIITFNNILFCSITI